MTHILIRQSHPLKVVLADGAPPVFKAPVPYALGGDLNDPYWVTVTPTEKDARKAAKLAERVRHGETSLPGWTLSRSAA